MRFLGPLYAFLTLLFTGLFVADLQGFFNPTRRPIAFLKQAHGTVRRLALNELTWDRSRKGSEFSLGDAIATGEASRATLVFSMGGELELGPGSMIALGGQLEDLKLSFVTGTGKMRVARSAQSKIQIARAAPVTQASQPEQQAEPAPALPPIAVAVVEDQEIRVSPPVAETAPDREVASGAPSPAPESSPFTPGSAVASAEPVEPVQEESLVPALAVKEEAILKKQEKLAKFTAPGELLTLDDLPPIPEPSFPSSDAVIDLTDQMPRLEWKAAQSPETEGKKFTYEITLREAEDKAQPITMQTDKPFLSLPRVGVGRYLWSVRAVSKKGTRGPASSSRWLEVRAPAQISQPIPLPVVVE